MARNVQTEEAIRAVLRGDTDNLLIRAFQDADVAIRHAESFSAVQDWPAP